MKPLQMVWTVSFRTNAEVWHTAVCASLEAVTKVLLAHGLDNEVYASASGEFTEYQSSKDKTQTATSHRVYVVE